MVEEGWATAHEGPHAHGLARIRQGDGRRPPSDAIREFPHGWAAFADVCRVAGRIDEALLAVAHGPAPARETAARVNEAERLRLRGANLRDARARLQPLARA